ncbi:ABC transporter substrate-binding protein [Humibacter ginsenosidimutans]|uniref:ABC transporter substrate-binding protein n=1 Tax=Humibacter ginsenosidimutans TaxID=2599293 RepID=A0A5B8M665_9MICO|nr:ABC transporter substrate-binding protein [Humibacter ginsenosidimutans]QDZ16087.1 ABC transporter substrate-binding protein [Humibacter ginsenosidimutans]
MTRPVDRPRASRIRRRILAVTTGAAIAALLAACAASPSGAEDATAATRTVATAMGKVAVPEHPLRVVSVHSWTTESLFDLGVTPVGVEDSGAQYVPSRYLARWKAVPKVTSGADIDFEKIASLKPDLIVGADVPYLHKAYAKLEAIAPTVFAPFTDATTWQTYPTYTASFVNRAPELKSLKAKYDSAIASVRDEYADQLSTLKWDIIQGGFDNGNYWIYSTTSDVGNVLTKLGAHFARATTDVKPGGTNSVSYEQADLLSDADNIIYYTNNDGSPANNIDKLFALPTFTKLPGAQKGHLIGTADFLPGSYSDAIGIVDTIGDALKAEH